MKNAGKKSEAENRRQKAENIRQSEEYFRTITQFANDAIITVNNKGIISGWNRSAEKIFGYTEEEITGKDLAVIIPQHYVKQYKNAINRIEQGGDYHLIGKTVEWIGLNKDGKEFPLELSLSACETASGKYFTGIIRDITERKLISDTQKFLLESGLPGASEDFFESLAKYLAQSLGMEYVCIDRLEGDGLTARTLAIYNDGKFDTNVDYALKETPCGDVVGKTICCFPEDVCRLFPNDITLQDLKAESYVGTTLWSFDGKPIGLIAVIGQKPLKSSAMAEALLKIVAVRAAAELERRQTEEALNLLTEELEIRVEERTAELLKSYAALRQNEEKFRTVADHTYDWEYWINAEGMFNYVSPSCERITGYASQEFMNDNNLIYKIIHPDDLNDFSNHVAHQFKVKDTCETEFRIKTKDGAIRWIGHACQPVFGINGEYLGKRGSNRDITEKVKAENELLNITVEVEERERNRISRELHDGLGPLLSTVKLYFQWLAETDDVEKIKIITEKGNNNIERAIQTAREVTHGLSSQILNNLGYVDAVINFTQIISDAHTLTIDFNFNSRDRFENFLETTLYRITIELIHNTLKYAKATHAEIEFNYHKEKNIITFTYTDNGIGFNIEDVEKTSRGLGLRNVRQRIKIIRGLMRIDSVIGKGMKVYIELPVSKTVI